MKDIINKFVTKSKIDINNAQFLYGGKQIDFELTFYEQANKIDKERDQMNILVYSIKEESKEEGMKESKEVICPQCKENCLISLENYRIKLYDCKNKHVNDNIALNEFKNLQKINENEIICKNCDNTKFRAYNNQFYKCADCQINLCPLCKEKHDKEHKIFDYNNINYVCLIHKDFYISYCKECKLNLCMKCEKEHNSNHGIINYKNILPDEDEIKQELKIFRNKIDKFKEIANEIIDVLNKVSEKMENYYQINYDILYNYNLQQRNYQILTNINSIKNFINLDDFDSVINDNNTIKFKFTYIIDIYNKIYNKKEKNNKIELNHDKISKEENIEKTPKDKKEREEKEESITKQSSEKTIIDCKILEKNDLNDKNISIKIINSEKVEGGIFGKNFSLYRLETSPFGWTVFRRFSDFENLKKLISKQFPYFYIPMLKNCNADSTKTKDHKINKQKKYLELFMNTLLENETFKTSKVLLAFLSYEDRNKLEQIFKEYNSNKDIDFNIEEYKTIDGKLIISSVEENEKYIDNTKKYFNLQNNLFENLNKNLRNFFDNMKKIDENLHKLSKDLNVISILNTRVLLPKIWIKSFETAEIFFSNLRKIYDKQNITIKTYFKDFYKDLSMDNRSLTELLEKRNSIKEKYENLKQKISKKEKSNKNINSELDENSLKNMYNQLAYATQMFMKELRKIMYKKHSVLLVENIKTFNEEFSPSINDLISASSNLKSFVQLYK